MWTGSVTENNADQYASLSPHFAYLSPPDFDRCHHDQRDHLTRSDSDCNEGNRGCDGDSAIDMNGTSISTCKANSDKSHDIPGIMHSLSRLQQELLRFGTSPSKDGESATPPDNERENEQNERKRERYSRCPVNAILNPCQDLVHIVGFLFSASRETGKESSSDWQMLLPLALTPLSLLLSIYGRILKEISTALHQDRVYSRAISSSRGSDGHDIHSGFSFSTGISTPPSIHRHSTSTNQQRRQEQFDNQPPRNTLPKLFPNDFDLTLGDLKVDRPLQLLLLATVVNHHLTYLEDRLHLYQMHHAQGNGSQGVPERFPSTILTEMKTSITVLVSEARDLCVRPVPCASATGAAAG